MSDKPAELIPAAILASLAKKHNYDSAGVNEVLVEVGVAGPVTTVVTYNHGGMSAGDAIALVLGWADHATRTAHVCSFAIEPEMARLLANDLLFAVAHLEARRRKC